MAHILSPAAEEILDKKFPLHDLGFVRLVDYLGSDASVVQMARTSYGDGTKTVREDRNLIRYLMRHHHDSPFEGMVIKLHIKCPIFVARQLFRHRSHSANEVSARYSVLPNDFYVPVPEDVSEQSTNNKQGRGEAFPLEKALNVSNTMADHFANSYALYEELLEEGTARELARTVLPVAVYTEFYWIQNVRNMLHMLALRLDSHAQKEIRDYAEVVSNIVKAVAPITYEAFEEYVIHAKSFSKEEMDVLRQWYSENVLYTPLTGSQLREFREKFE